MSSVKNLISICILVFLGIFLPGTANATVTFVSDSSIDSSGNQQHEATPVYSTAAAIEPGHLFVMIIGMKPSLENRGEVTTPAGWTRIASTTGGGYGVTLANDTGNTHLFAFTKMADGSERDTRTSVTMANDSVAWSLIYRFSNTLGGWDVATTSGEDTSGDISVSIAMDSDPGVTSGDHIIATMAIPTDVTTAAQFSSEAITQSGITFGSVVETGEPDVVNGMQAGGFVVRTSASSGTSSGAPTLTATAGGTVTNVRGPGLFIRIREVAAPGVPTLSLNDGGSNQIAFKGARQNDTTPIIRASAPHSGTFDRFQVEFNTQADFLGTSYTETFSSTYSAATEYNLQTTGSLGLPTTDGATYYVRVRASADSGDHWGPWSDARSMATRWSYTYKSSGNADWFQTTSDQFREGTTTNAHVSTTTPNSIDLTYLPNIEGFTTAATTDPATSITLIKPQGVSIGDLLLILVGNDAANSTVQWDGTTNFPRGFTIINESGNTTSDAHDAAFYRIADGTEQFSTSTTNVTSSDAWGYYLRVSGVDTTTPIDVIGADSCNAVSTSCAITSVNTTVAHTLAFYLHSFDGGDGNPFGISGTGWSKVDGVNATGGTQGDTGSAGGSFGTRVSPSIGATGNATVSTAAASDGFSGFQFAVRPALLTSGTILSSVIDYDSYDGASSWDEASWSETETAGTVSVRVLGSNTVDCDTQVIAPTATSPIDLSSLTSTGAGQLHNRICLEATLTYSAGSPLLNDWTVSWVDGGGGVAPTVTTNFAVPGFNSANLHGTKTGGDNATEHGFAYSTNSTLSTGVSTTTLGALDGNHAFPNYVTGLSPDQTYFFRAYAINGTGTGFGEIKSFITGNSTVSRNLRLFNYMRFLNGLIQLNQQ